MQIQLIEARIFYRFELDELKGLALNSLPLSTQINAVSTATELASWRSILRGEYFRTREASAVHHMLVRAGKYARTHLDEYFPVMRPAMIAAIEEFEEAVLGWWEHFCHDQKHVEPTP